MTDLSYTNKDGLNLYEGFSNGFDYHKDGAAEGDGYEHGGYPEITGETSEYTDTSYKTGDNPDFFDNGNVWEQPSVNPGPEPGPVVTDIKIIRNEGSAEEPDWEEADLATTTVAQIYSSQVVDDYLTEGEIRMDDSDWQKVMLVYDDGTEAETTTYTLTPVVGDKITYSEHGANGTLTASGITKNILIYVEDVK